MNLTFRTRFSLRPFTKSPHSKDLSVNKVLFFAPCYGRSESFIVGRSNVSEFSFNVLFQSISFGSQQGPVHCAGARCRWRIANPNVLCTQLLAVSYL